MKHNFDNRAAFQSYLEDTGYDTDGGNFACIDGRYYAQVDVLSHETDGTVYVIETFKSASMVNSADDLCLKDATWVSAQVFAEATEALSFYCDMINKGAFNYFTFAVE